MKRVQEKVKKFSVENAFDKETLEQKMLLLMEEVGEFAKATRKSIGIKVGDHSKDRNLNDEAADVLYILSDICSLLNINLDDALNSKIKKFKKRKYSSR